MDVKSNLTKHADFIAIIIMEKHFKDIDQPKFKNEGGQEGNHLIPLGFLHNRRCFLGTLKGVIFCFKF